MLRGTFKNCYGIKDLSLDEIDFDASSVAIIYAPNGVMKTSLTRVFDDIRKGSEPKDELFPSETTSYTVDYRTWHFSNGNTSSTENIYVIKSFDEKFVSRQESITSLLADESTRSQYDVIMNNIADELKTFRANLANLTGFTKPKVEEALRKDFNILAIEDWPVLISKIRLAIDNEDVPCLVNVKYTDIINDKTEQLLKSDEFLAIIAQYAASVNELLTDNPILNRHFNDYHAEQLGKQLNKFDLFKANHKILLNDGRIITSLSEWNGIVKAELEQLYHSPQIKEQFAKIRKLLNANADTQRLCTVITQHKEVIPLFANFGLLKKCLWKTAFNQMDVSLQTYAEHLSAFSEEIQALYQVANSQAEKWAKVIEEFNLRFKVPFSVRIENKANVLLKDEAPHIVFDYHQSNSSTGLTKAFKKEELMGNLSMGERRAMYLLYILFDVEAIKEKAQTEHVLIVADDIADSFDYKNKFAIIEYLRDIAEVPNTDLLILTHNYDFYRTVSSRLQPILKSPNCLLAQRQQDGVITVKMMRYQKDFFRRVVVQKLKGNANVDIKDKYLITSIPFYRNLCEYGLLDDDYKKLTCLLHLKTEPINTEAVKMSEIFEVIPESFRTGLCNGSSDSKYIDKIEQIARDIVSHDINEAFLENKLILSMAIRLEAEYFLRNKLIANGVDISCSRDQTHVWTEKAMPFLNDEEKTIIKEVNMLTAEGIHINSFMYEPLIDLSDWALKDLYSRILVLNDKGSC